MYSENIGELALALAKAQGEMRSAVKDTANSFFKSKYANLDSIISAIRDPLAKYGLSFSQIPHEIEGTLYLVSCLMHQSGQKIEGRLPIRIKSDGKINELQEMGKALTYLKRYALSAMIGVSCDEDDDGNTSVGYTADNAKQAPKTVTISDTQANVLSELLKKGPIGYEAHFMNHLKSTLNLASLKEIPVALFQEMLTSVNQQISRTQNVQKPAE